MSAQSFCRLVYLFYSKIRECRFGGSVIDKVFHELFSQELLELVCLKLTFYRDCHTGIRLHIISGKALNMDIAKDNKTVKIKHDGSGADNIL